MANFFENTQLLLDTNREAESGSANIRSSLEQNLTNIHLLLTKPLHHSQKVLQPFGEHDGQWYGEVRITIEPNRELRGRILLYGENLEVVSPLSLREQIKEILKEQMEQYEK